MKRFILPVAAAALVAACSDANDPSSDATLLPDAASEAEAPLADAALSGPRRGSRAAPVGRRRAERQPDPRQPRHRRDLARHRPVRGQVRPQRHRLRLRRHDPERLQPGARRSSPRRGHLSPNGVYVETKNQGGGLTDGPFNLLVACGPLNTRFAVVGYSANLIRATSGTTLTPLGSGPVQRALRLRRSRLRLPRDRRRSGQRAWSSARRACTPAAARTRDTVYIETKNPGGGLQDGVPFHLASSAPAPAPRGSPW